MSEIVRVCVCVYKWHEALVFVCLWNSQRFLTTYCNCHFITMQLIMASLSFSLYLSLWPLLSLSPTLFLYLFIYELTASFFYNRSQLCAPHTLAFVLFHNWQLALRVRSKRVPPPPFPFPHPCCPRRLHFYLIEKIPRMQYLLL